MEKAKITMLARVLGIFVFGFLIGITLSASAQEITELLVDEGKTTDTRFKEITISTETSTGTLQTKIIIEKLDSEKTTQELIADKVDLTNTIKDTNYLASKYAKDYDSCRFATGFSR